MKKLLLLLATVGVLLTACEGGGNVEEENGGDPFIPEISCSPKSLEFKSHGEEKEVVIVANFEYDVTENADWVDIEIIDTGINVITKRNEDTVERSTNIIISNEKYNITEIIAVKQSAYVPKIELSRQSVEVTFESAEYSVSVTSPYSWAATSKNDWIIVENQTGIAGTKELIFSVEYNEIDKIREGTIVIKNEDYNLVAELYVIQKAFEPTIIIEPETLAFETEGGEQEVKIIANFEYEVSASAEWLSFTKNENGVTVTVPNYVEMEERTAEMTISNEKYNISKVVEVTQKAFKPSITIEPETLNFTIEGGEQEVEITTNFEYEVSVSAEWVSYTKNENGIIVTVPNYEGVENRTTEVVVLSEKYSVSKIIQIKQYGLYQSRAIFYTSTDGKIVTPYKTNVFGANIISNTYEDGRGVIIFRDDVTSIGGSAFYNCTSLTSITIPDSVTSIGEWAFRNCTSLTSVTIPDNVTSIGEWAFWECTSLKSITIPDSVTSIGNYAFRYCTSLTSVTIGNSVTSIGREAFNNCDLLTAFYGKFASSDNRCLIVDGVLNSFAPAGLTSYTIPNSVTSIGYSAFDNCTSLTSITIPDSVTSIGDSAFVGCTSLTSVTIPDSVTEIGSCAFSFCTSLTSVTIPDSVTSIGNWAFWGCTSLTSITIPDSVTEIGKWTFNGCDSLTSITIPDSVTSIGERAFRNCTSLTSVAIPDSVTSIGERAFSECSSLTSVTIPNSVTSIGYWAFYNCTSLKEIYCKATTPPISDGGDMFGEIISGRKIYVPVASVEAYKTAEYWSSYADHIEGYDF